MIWMILAVAMPPAISSVICGQPAFCAPFAVIKTAVDMEHFGKMKEDFLREFLDLPGGIPCHDAYSRLPRLMKPASFQAFSDTFRADFTT